jgi:hypothetical protein
MVKNFHGENVISLEVSAEEDFKYVILMAEVEGCLVQSDLGDCHGVGEVENNAEQVADETLSLDDGLPLDAGGRMVQPPLELIAENIAVVLWRCFLEHPKVIFLANFVMAQLLRCAEARYDDPEREDE